jgi:hypothetical protein
VFATTFAELARIADAKEVVVSTAADPPELAQPTAPPR